MADALAWSEAFAVGHEELDAEHHRMLALVNELCEAGAAPRKAGVAARLRELRAVTEKHFAHEEALLRDLASGIDKNRQGLRKIVATAVDEHGVEHRQRLSDLRAMARRASRLRKADAGATFCDELRAWFIDHAIGYDAQIKTILRSA